MKRRNFISVLLSTSLLCGTLLFPAAPINASAEAFRSYVIWEAAPQRVGTENGATAKPWWLLDDNNSYTFGYKVTGSAVLALDEELTGYACTLTGSGHNNGAVLDSGLNIHSGDGNMGWMQSHKLLSALAPYLTVSYDVYIEDAQNRSVSVEVLPAPVWTSEDPYTVCGEFDQTEQLQSNIWHTRSEKVKCIQPETSSTPHWADGSILISATAGNLSSNQPVTVKLRGLRLELSESDRSAVNAAVAATGVADTLYRFTADYQGVAMQNLPRDESGGIDYFSLLTAFDDNAESSSNLYTANIRNPRPEGGTASLSSESCRAGTAVTVTLNPADGYIAQGLVISSAAGGTVAYTKSGDHSYRFHMPRSDVTVTSVWVRESDAVTQGRTYVMWEADPNRLSKEESPLASQISGGSWINANFTGSAQIVSGELPYYSVTLNQNGADGVAALKSGLTASAFPTEGWMSDRVLLALLMPYFTMEFDARRVDSSAANPTFTFAMAPEWYNISDGCSRFGYADAGDPLNIMRNEWHSYSFSKLNSATAGWVDDFPGDHWQGGLFAVGASATSAADAPSAENPVQVDIRRMRLILREEDRLAINQLLAESNYDPGASLYDYWQVYCYDSNLPLDQNGNKDYFSLMIRYDASSTYGAQYTIANISDSAHGASAVAGSATAGSTVEITTCAEPGYSLQSLSVTSLTDGAALETSVKNGVYRFTMPALAVAVNAVYIPAVTSGRECLTVWDSAPEQTGLAAGADASPAWRAQNAFVSGLTGTSGINLSEDIGCYSTVLSETGYENGAAVTCSTAQSLLYNTAVLEAAAPYLNFECDLRIDVDTNLKAKPTLALTLLSPQTQNGSPWDIGGAANINQYDSGYETGRWFSVRVKGLSMSSNLAKLAWQGDLLVTLEAVSGYTQSCAIGADFRRIRLTLDPADRADVDAALAAIGIENGFDRLTGADSSSVYSTAHPFGDANVDSSVDLRDLVRLKKKLAGSENIICFASVDYNDDSVLDSSDLSALKRQLLGELYVTPVCDHPGVVEMDAEYSMLCIGKDYLSDGDFTLSCSNSLVTVKGSEITVPYAVRASGEPLVVTAVSRESPAQSGTYTFRFTEFSADTTYSKNFNDLTGWRTDGDVQTGTLENGELVFRIDREGQQKYCVYSDFTQSYGCFSACIKMPQIGTANAAFFLIGNNYIENPVNSGSSYGEIDIVEYFPTWGENWAGTVHWYLWNESLYCSSGNEGLYGSDIKNGYHTFSAVWTENAIYWYYDNQLCRVYNGPGVAPGSGPMKLLLQLNPEYTSDGWGGAYDSTAYPYEMRIDWVDVWALKQ